MTSHTPKYILWLLLLIGVAVALTGCIITIETPPLKYEDFCADLNFDGVLDRETECGPLAVYDGNEEIIFSWDPYDFPEGTNGSYRISLLETEYETLTQRELKVAHHWGSNPNGTQFAMGSFGFGEDFRLCPTCYFTLFIMPETYAQYYDEDTGVYEYEYTLLFDEDGLPVMLWFSEAFLIDIFRP